MVFKKKTLMNDKKCDHDLVKLHNSKQHASFLVFSPIKGRNFCRILRILRIRAFLTNLNLIKTYN